MTRRPTVKEEGEVERVIWRFPDCPHCYKEEETMVFMLLKMGSEACLYKLQSLTLP